MDGSTPEVSAARGAALTAEGDAVLLDVREPDEWEVGHAPHAVHAPLSSLELGDLPTDRPIVAICRSGARSGQLTEVLVGRGYDIVNLTGGMVAWAEAGLPVVRDDGSPGEIL